MRILVVDDEPSVRDALDRALRMDGYRVQLAADGTEALDALAQAPPDAIVLDVLMPEPDGLEVCRKLRAAGDRTPVLMLTARDIDAAIREVLRTRPVLSITARGTLPPYPVGGYTLPKDVYVAACLYLAHRRAGTAFDPARAPAAHDEAYSYVPFGGGTRRCLGAAFALLELREVIRAVTQRFTGARPAAGRADAPPRRRPRPVARRLDHPNSPMSALAARAR